MVSTQWERPEGITICFTCFFFFFCTSFAACVQRAKLFISMTLDVIEVVATRKAKVIKTESWPKGWYFRLFGRVVDVVVVVFFFKPLPYFIPNYAIIRILMQIIPKP